MLERDNIELQRKLEEERTNRIELEKSLAPRDISLTHSGSGLISPAGLKPFAGTRAILVFVPEEEPMRAARRIERLLVLSGWRVENGGPASAQDRHWAGVTVQSYVDEETGATDSSCDAALELIRILELSDWAVANRGEFIEVSVILPPRTVRIVVDLQANPYIVARRLSELDEQMRKSMGLRCRLLWVLLMHPPAVLGGGRGLRLFLLLTAVAATRKPCTNQPNRCLNTLLKYPFHFPSF
jgi:hypothetical protein